MANSPCVWVNTRRAKCVLESVCQCARLCKYMHAPKPPVYDGISKGELNQTQMQTRKIIEVILE